MKKKCCRKEMKHLGFNFYRCIVCGQDYVVRKTGIKMKETLKQFVFRRLASGEYLLDAEVARFCRANNWNEKKDIPFMAVETYKREYRNLEACKDEFDACEDVVIFSYRNEHKGAKTKYHLRYKGMEKNQSYKITKAYFLYLKEKGVKEVDF